MIRTIEAPVLEVSDTFECPLDHTPNEATLAAMQEVQDMIDGKLPCKHFKSLEEFWKDLDSCKGTMNKKYKSEAMMVTHEAMKGLFDAGIIDATQMGAFDARCLVPETSVTQEAKSSGSPSVPANPHVNGDCHL